MEAKDTEYAIKDLKAHKLPSLFSHRQCYFIGRDAGIKEVVEFIDSRVQFPWSRENSFEEWLVQLKKWGITLSTNSDT